MDVEFECGATATGVAMPALAARAHIGKCDDAACQADVKRYAERNRGTLID